MRVSARSSARRIGGSRDEPQVERVLALVVVVHLGLRADLRRDALERRGRHVHCRQRARTDRVRAEHRADARQRAVFRERVVARQHAGRVEPDFFGDARERLRFEREVALPAVEQLEIDGVGQIHGRARQKPVLRARAVRKMPLGRSAAMRTRSA